MHKCDQWVGIVADFARPAGEFSIKTNNESCLAIFDVKFLSANDAGVFARAVRHASDDTIHVNEQGNKARVFIGNSVSLNHDS